MSEFSEPFSNNLYLEYDDEDSSHRFKKLILNPQFEKYSILGSCNGLVCVSGLPNHYTKYQSIATSSCYVAYICNPISGESITLPELDRSKYFDLHPCMLSGFGYVAPTNVYKVVRLYSFCGEHEFTHIEVYTLGSGQGWRNVGKINRDWGFVSRENAGLVDGFLYWKFRKGRILVFDLANEIFVELDEYYKWNFWGGVLGGHYRGIHNIEEGKSTDVWLLKKKQDESLMTWSKGFSLTNIGGINAPLALPSSSTVLCGSDTKLQLYDLKSSSSKLVADIGKPFCVAIPHRNTLVSLAALGEITKTLESRESAIEEAKGRD